MSLDKIEARDASEKPVSPLPWWWSTDEERYHGPSASRGSAIMEAWAEGNRGTIYVCQATSGGFSTDLFDEGRIAELFDDANEDRGDPDGDPPSEWIKSDAWRKLAERMNHQIAAFIREQGIRSWTFDAMGSHETIDLSLPILMAMPADAREVLADLVSGWSAEHPWSPSYFDLRIKELAEALGVKPVAEVSP